MMIDSTALRLQPAWVSNKYRNYQ